MKIWKMYALWMMICIGLTGCGQKETGSQILNETKEAVEPVAEVKPVVESTEEGVALHIYCGDDYAEYIEQKTVYVDEVTEQTVMENLAQELGMDDHIQMKEISFGMHGGDKVLMLDMNQAFADYLRKMGTAGEYIIMGSLVNTFLDCYQCDIMLVTVEGKVLETGHEIYEEYLEMYPYVEDSYRVTEMLLEEGNMRISCPQIEGLEDEEMQGKWNRIFLGTEERAMDEWNGVGTYEVKYTVKTMSADLLSILMEGAIYDGHADHPYTFKYTYNVDLRTGGSVRLTNLVDVDKVAENMFAGTGYYVDESLAPYFIERLETIYETPYALARSLEGYDYREDGSAPYGYSYIKDGQVRICMEVPHEMGDYIEIELSAQ